MSRNWIKLLIAVVLEVLWSSCLCSLGKRDKWTSQRVIKRIYL